MKALTLLLLLAGLASGQMPDPRKKALDRPRRIIFNNDGGESAVEMKTATKQEFLDCRTTKLAGTQVDSIFYCTRTSGFGVFTHFTKIGQVFTCTEGRYAGNMTGALLKAGLDPLTMQVEFGKQHNIEVFWSLRMNDTHDGSKTDYGPIMFNDNKLKTGHPEYLLGSIKKPLKHGAWSAVDYSKPEVRDLAFKYIEEVCRNYDIDGVELDFFRHPVFFKSTSRGEVATAEECAMMTELLKRVRTMTEEVGKSRGRPILIAIKMPDSAEYGKAIGLDIENWMKAGLLDLYIPGGYFQLNNWRTSIDLARKHGVKVYPSLDEPRLRDKDANEARRAEAGYRGRAAESWGAGSDGIYLFNFPDVFKGAELLKEIGDAKTLAKYDRDYFACPRGVGNAAGGNLPYAAFQKLETLNPGNPKPLTKQAITRLEVGESLTNETLTLRFQVKNVPDVKQLQATINDQKLKLSTAANDWLECRVTPEMIRRGTNTVSLMLDEAPKNAAWTDLVLQVRVPQ